MGAPGRPPGPSLESDERPPGWRALFVWPMPALAALLILGVYIAIAQMMTSFKLQYYYDYTADVVVSEFSYTDEVDSGVASKSYVYNVWNGARQLWNDGAFMIALLVVTWSGLWPYGKLLILAYALWTHRRRRLPVAYEWLSTLAHWSFVDVWMVVAAAMLVRFSYDGDDEDTVDDVCKLKITLLVWIASVAKGGVYHFFAAIAASQALGFVAMKYAQTPPPPYARDSWLTSPSRNWWCLAYVHYQRWGSHFPALRDSYATPSATTRCLERARDAARRAAPLLVPLVGVAAPVGAWCLLYWGFHMPAVHAAFEFELVETIDDSFLDGLVTIDKTFTFHETTRASYSVVTGIEALLHDVEPDIGNDSADLARIATHLVVYLPLIRIVTVLALWVVPAPHAAHVLLQWLVEFISLFVNHDVFMLALGIMIVEIPLVFADAIPGDDAADLGFYSRIEGGFWVVVLAVVLENVLCVTMMRLHADAIASQQLAPVELPSTDLTLDGVGEMVSPAAAAPQRSASKGELSRVPSDSAPPSVSEKSPLRPPDPPPN